MQIFPRYSLCCPPFGFPQADFSLSHRQSPAEQRPHPGKVVTSEFEDRLRLHFRRVNNAGFAQTAIVLLHPKIPFNQLALFHAESIARMPGCKTIERRAGLLRRHMRRHLQAAQRLHEVGAFVALVRTQRAVRLDCPGCHLQRRLALRLAGGQGHFNINHQAVTILHQGVLHVALAGFVSCTLLEEPRMIIGRRGVGLIATLFAFEIHRRIPAAPLRAACPNYPWGESSSSRPRFQSASRRP